jgi:hypothetical protein
MHADELAFSDVRSCYNLIMGVITIEVPQPVTKRYKLKSEKSATEVIEKLDRLVKRSDNGMTGRKRIDFSGVIGMWADRPESTEEIARKLRRGWESDNDVG